MAASFAAAIAGCGRAWPVQYRRFERETDRSSLADAFDGSLAELTTAIPKETRCARCMEPGFVERKLLGCAERPDHRPAR